jgi:hypothetical protein
MLRKLVLWFLLLPLPLNGLWVACDDAVNADQATTPDSAELTQQQLDCARICAMKHQGIDGPICIILPGNAKTSITIFNFGVAVIPAKVEISPVGVLESYVTELPAMYTAPNVLSATPPPRG